MTRLAARPIVVDTTVLEQSASAVRCDRRSFPVVFTGARGAELFTEHGRAFIDFFCRAGALPYGHNHPHLTRRLTEYVRSGARTVAEHEFLHTFREVVLAPRELRYTVRFCGTGADAVAAAVAEAHRATGRCGVVEFAGASDSIDHLERTLATSPSGMDRPAAVLVEPVRLADDAYPASLEWLRELRALTERHGILLICNETRSGCGRTGPYFGFEHAGVAPDAVILSGSLSGHGVPLAVTLLRPELDVWAPGEHDGTFRVDQCALVTGTAALEVWQQPHFRTGHAVAVRRLDRFAKKIRVLDPDLVVRGRGMALGIDTGTAGGAARAERVQRLCFDDGLVVGLCGRNGQVVAVLPPLTVDPARHDRGLEVLERALCASG